MKRSLLAAVCLLVPFTLQAQTITVDSVNDSGPGTLRQAIADASSGGTIVFHPSLSFQTITLTSGELLINKDLTITGPGADRMAIDGNDASRVFHITSGITAAITDVTIQNGRAADGGFEDDGEFGGGILNDGGVLTLVQVVVTNNRAGDGGDGSFFVGGRGGWGGGISSSYGTLTVINSTISNNRAGNGGDCLSCDGGHGGVGGAIQNYQGSVHIVRSTIADNSTGDGGDCINCTENSGGNGGDGGAYWGGGTQTGLSTMESSTVSGNQTGSGGAPNGQSGKGGALAFIQDMVISNSTITDNDGRQSGGLTPFLGLPSVDVLNSIIAGNTEEGSSLTATADCQEFGPGAYTSLGFNLVGAGTGCPATGTGDQTINPADVFTTALGPVQDNGGLTQTHALLSNSPAIDQGSCSGVDADQRGYGGSSSGPRIVDEPQANADDGCDVGAFEHLGTLQDLVVHFKRPAGWGYPHVHYFSTTPDIGNSTWPGEPMVHEGCGWYRYRFGNAGMAHMVFNGYASPQTADLFRSGWGWYDGTSDVWSEAYPDPPCTDIVMVRPRIFLQGPYQGAEEMSSSLTVSGNLPSTQPYGSAEFTDPLKHNGDETWPDFLPAAIATDWSIVELRTGHSADSKVAAKAAIHLIEGSLVDPLVLGPVVFTGVAPDSYFVVVRHRNHLPIMSANLVDLNAAGVVYDFTDDSAKAFGTNPMIQMPDGMWAMWAADANSDGNVQALDFNEYISATAAGASGYELADFNMDTNVQALDFNLYVANTTAGVSSQVPE